MPHPSARSRRTLAGVALTGTLLTGAIAAPAAVAAPAAAPPVGSPAVTAAAPATESSAENALLKQLNAQRAKNGLGPLTRSTALFRAAYYHNAKMSAAQTLSHQLPGEPSFSQRITDQGYVWRAAAENIGYTTDTSATGSIAIQKAFYNEVPPNDGHRRNILSTSVTQVGISVYVDTHGKLWVTEDFAAPLR